MTWMIRKSWNGLKKTQTHFKVMNANTKEKPNERQLTNTPSRDQKKK